MGNNNGNIIYTGSIPDVQLLEDSIRATKKYTEGIRTKREHRPIQGAEFSSRKFCKYYEVYPTLEVGWQMSIIDAIFWLGKGVSCVDVLLEYDYRSNKARVIMDGEHEVQELKQAIPGFRDAIERVIANGNGHQKITV